MHEVIEYTRDDIAWPFHTNQPYLRIGRAHWGKQVHIDPTPAYSHDADLTRRTLERVAHLFPVDWPVAICLLPCEDVSRTNGSTTIDQDYDYEKVDEKGRHSSKQFGTIELSAKRIPPHPAMTRYLVAHEYGHVVEEWLNIKEGGQLHDDALIARYAEMRGLTKPKSYGAGTWHATPGEVFANDFRLLVCGIEPEYWPHEGIELPYGNAATVEFWRERARKPLFLGPISLAVVPSTDAA